MKIKKTVIAVTSAAAIVGASPTFANGLEGFYASLRIGLQFQDNGDGEESTTGVESFTSRLGYKTEMDLGNGTIGYGMLEFGIDAEDNNKDENGDEDSTSIRHGFAGLKGNFGNLYIGQTHHTFFKYAVAPVDIPYWYSGANMISFVGRTGDGLTYSKDIGGLSFGATGYFDNNSENEGTELGISYDFGPVKIAAAQRDLDSFDDPLSAFTVSTKFGDLGVAAMYQDQGDIDSLEASITYKSFYAQIGEFEGNKGTTLGYTLNLGKNTSAWFEIFNRSTDDGTDSDKAAIATLRYDIF